jgi:hypothetical protein
VSADEAAAAAAAAAAGTFVSARSGVLSVDFRSRSHVSLVCLHSLTLHGRYALIGSFIRDFAGEAAPVLPAFIDGPCVESSYLSRKPLKSQPGRDLNTAESHILTLAEKNESLSAAVVCTGTLFGHGEYFFAPFFREAWMCERPVRCLDNASNRIPTLHVQDAVSIVCDSKAWSCPALLRAAFSSRVTSMLERAVLSSFSFLWWYW